MIERRSENKWADLRVLRKPALAAFGLGLGGLFLWLALRQVEFRNAGAILQGLDIGYLLLAIATYWVSIALRIFRWRRMLNPYYPSTRLQIAETLIVGFAVNYILPARLGELFRADYAKRRFEIPRSAAVGSIAVERLTDGVVVVCCLWLGLVLATQASESFAAEHLWVIQSIANVGAAIFAVATVCVVLIVRYRIRLHIGPEWLRVRAAAFVDGLTTFKLVWTWGVLSLSLAVWGTEALALWFVFKSMAVELSLAVTLMLIGAATLSTLVPTAPGFIGSYQLGYVAVMNAVGVSAEVGLIAATTIQITFFGTVTLTGIAIFLSRQLLGTAKAFVEPEYERAPVREESES